MAVEVGLNCNYMLQSDPYLYNSNEWFSVCMLYVVSWKKNTALLTLAILNKLKYHANF